MACYVRPARLPVGHGLDLISQPNVMGEQRTGNVNQRKRMISFPLKAKRRQQVVLGCHLRDLWETLYKLTDKLVIYQSQYQEKN
jgi:hypothetical protein